jgi:hypothetical protein
MLPIYLDRPMAEKPTKDFRFNLTREGYLQPWVRLRTTEAEEKTRLEEMPPFQVLNAARDIKPGASVLATVTDDANQKFPALVAQRFGRGRTVALMVGDIWRWGMKDELSHRDMDKAWRQMVRSLVVDVPNRIDVHAENLTESGAPAVSLQVRVKDKVFDPMENGSVTVTVEPVATPTTGATAASKTQAVTLTADPSQDEPGLYEATYVPHDTGGFRAVATVKDAQGIEVGEEDTGWTSDPAADEFRSLKPNRELLETIARKTGGEIIAADKLEAFTRQLPNLKAPITETVTSPLWHSSIVFLFAIACITAEWGLRRWKGLA